MSERNMKCRLFICAEMWYIIGAITLRTMPDALSKGGEERVKRWIAAALLVIIAFSLCACEKKMQRFSRTYWDLFDTYTTFICYAESEEDFNKASGIVYDTLLECHRLFDGYNTYEGINNLYVLNSHAMLAPVKVDEKLFDLIDRSMVCSDVMCDKVNIAMGSVLILWHNERENGINVPGSAALQAASGHCSRSDVVLDREQMTVFYADPELRMDLGAVAKGYAVEMAAQALAKNGYHSYLISAGGNVRVGDAPADGRKYWNISIQDPDDASSYMDVIQCVNCAVVTSGDYQRYYEVDGVRYHHIISPDTLYPARGMRSVTVVAPDSMTADFLSTALFILPAGEGDTLLANLEGAEAYRITDSGEVLISDGMKRLLIK